MQILRMIGGEKMNKTMVALGFKFVMTFFFAVISFYVTDNPLNWVVIVSLAATGLNYLIGDLFVLPNMGNIVASLGDGIMGAITAYIIDLISPVFSTTITSLAVFAFLVAIGEYFFHLYLQKSEKVAP